MKDEDGHTAMEKAKERADEWHKQVVEVLLNAGTCIRTYYTYFVAIVTDM